MKKGKRLICAFLCMCVIMTCVSVPVFAQETKAASQTQQTHTLDDYPDEAYLVDANDKKSIEAVKGFSASKKNVHESEYAAEWSIGGPKSITFSSITDIAGYETLEFYMYGDEKRPTSLMLTISAQNPDVDGSDYYKGGVIEVLPGWNKYEFSISDLKKQKIGAPKKLYEIDGICLYATGWGLEEKNDFSTVLYLDSVKLTKGSELLDKRRFLKPETEAGTAKYFEYKFEETNRDDIKGISFAEKSNKIELINEKRRRYLKISALGTSDDCFIDIPVNYTRRYTVIGGDFMVEENDRAAVLITCRDAAGNQNTFVELNKKNEILAGDTYVGKMEPGKWVNITVCIDMDSFVYNVYLDNKLVLKNVGMLSDIGRISLVRSFIPVKCNVKMSIDNFVMYDGKTPSDYKKAVNEPTPLALDESGAEVAIKEIDVNTTNVPKYKQAKPVSDVKDAVCLKVDSPFALVRHEQKAIDETNKNVAPFVINGRTLVPVRFISEAFGAQVGWDAGTRTVTIAKDSDVITLAIGSNILNKNGEAITIDVPAEIYYDRTMLPLRAVTENLGKKVFWDDMGLIIISDNEINFTKEKDLDKMIDIMAGFIYERPGQEKLKADLLAKTPDHPRVLATAQDFARMRNLMYTDANMSKWMKDLIATADKFVAAAPTEGDYVYIGGTDGRLGNDYAIISRVTSMGIAWQMTHDMKYPNALWLLLEDVCAWENWHPGHFLNTADMMQGVAMAYDWMYDAWTPEQKTILEEALYKNGIVDAITAYHGANDKLTPPMGIFQRSGWWSAGSNWNAHCNGGIMVAGIAMATHEKYGDLAIKMMDYALNGIEMGLRCYAPDGGYEEGPSYWGYGTNSAIMLMAALTTATGSNYGLSDSPGFANTYANPLYMESKLGMFNFSDTDLARSNTASLFWFGNEYNSPYINRIRFDELVKGEKRAEYTDIIWYRPENIAMDASLALDFSFYKLDTMTMRSSWSDENQMFVGFHGAKNDAAHGHIDAGSFVLDALGVRWFIDVGKDNYNLPNYFGSSFKRYLYYATRAEGHNTIVVNPGSLDYGQMPTATAKVTEFVSKARGSYGKIDMTAVHGKNVSSATRGVMMTANRKATIIQDEMVLKEAPYEFYWFAHTKEDVEIAPDGRSAVLTRGTKKLHVALVSDNADLKFGVMDAEYLPSSPARPESKTEKENSREGIRKLFIHGTGSEKVNFAVVCQPLVGNVTEYEYTYTPLANWSIPDGAIYLPKATDIKMDGVTIPGFNGYTTTGYDIVLPYGTTYVPQITATAEANCNVQVTMPDSLPGTAMVKIVNNSDPLMYSVYTVSMRAAKELEMEFSGEQEGNYASHCMDGDLTTRWAVEGEAWATFTFSTPKTMSAVWLASWKSDIRKLVFDIEVSTDGVNFTQVWSGQSSVTSDILEEFKIPAGTYKAVKLVLHGTTAGAWNSILEVEFK